MVVAPAVNAVVGRVLSALPDQVRGRCDRAMILIALDGLGCATTLADLQEMSGGFDQRGPPALNL